MSEAVYIEKPAASSGDYFFNNAIWNRADPIADFRGQAGTELLNRMSYDAELGAGLGHIKYPLMAGDWRVDAAEEDNAEEEDIAENCRRMLMPGSIYGYAAQSTTWNERLEHGLTMLDQGFALFEKRWGRDKDGNQVIASIDPILPTTVIKWNYTDDGDWAGFTQRAWWPNGEFLEKDVEADRLIPVVFARQGRSMWGRAITRKAYLSWYAKKTLVILDGIIKERFGGVPIAEDMPGVTNTGPAIELLKKTIANFRIHHEQSLYAAGFKIRLEFPSGANSNILESIKYHDAAMAQIVMSEMMKLGLAQGGSRAVGDTKAGLLFIAMSGIAACLEDAFTQYAIIPYVNARWGERDKYPRLVAPDFSKMRSGELMPLIKDMVDAQVITPDDKLEEFVRQQLTLPAQDKSTSREPLPPMLPGAGGGSSTGGNPKPPNRAKLAPKAKQLADPYGGRFWRAPHSHEAFAEFDKYAEYLNAEPARLWHRQVAPLRREQIKTIARSAARATDAQLAGMKFAGPNPKVLADRLASGLLSVYAQGRRSVLMEAKRQGAAVPALLAGDDMDAELEALGAKSAESGWVKKMALSLATGIIGAMMLRAKEVGMQQRNKTEPPSVSDQQAAVVAALTGLSEASLLAEISGRMATAFSNGRNEQASSMKDQIVTCYYSAIMDQGTCEVCAALDGAEHELDDPDYETPNPNCDWPPYCRCTTVHIFRPDESAVAEAA